MIVLDKNNSELPDIHRRVLNEIINAPNGYIKKDKLLLKLEKPSSFWRSLNEIINDLIVKYGYIIGSSRQYGYYVCKTEEDITNAIYTIESHAFGMFERRDVLVEARKMLK